MKDLMCPICAAPQPGIPRCPDHNPRGCAVFPLRHLTLGIFFHDPSPAMEAWVMADLAWHDMQEYVSSSGVPLDEATQCADSQALNNYNQKGN